MEVHFSPDVEARFEQLARDSGCRSEALVDDAVAGLFDEVAYARDMLDRRYDDLESGKVKLIDGDEAYRSLIAKTDERRRRGPA